MPGFILFLLELKSGVPWSDLTAVLLTGAGGFGKGVCSSDRPGEETEYKRACREASCQLG